MGEYYYNKLGKIERKTDFFKNFRKEKENLKAKFYNEKK